MEPLGEASPPGTAPASNHSRDEPDAEMEQIGQAAHVAAGAFQALPRDLLPEGLDPMDACRQLMLSSVEGVALSQYAEDKEPEAEGDTFSRIMNEASVQLSGGPALGISDDAQVSTMVIAPLAGSPASGPGPLLPDTDTEASTNRVNALQLSQLSMRSSVRGFSVPSTMLDSAARELGHVPNRTGNPSDEVAARIETMASANTATRYQDSASLIDYEHASDPVDPARSDNLRRVVAAVLESSQSDANRGSDQWTQEDARADSSQPPHAGGGDDIRSHIAIDPVNLLAPGLAGPRGEPTINLVENQLVTSNRTTVNTANNMLITDTDIIPDLGVVQNTIGWDALADLPAADADQYR